MCLGPIIKSGKKTLHVKITRHYKFGFYVFINYNYEILEKRRGESALILAFRKINHFVG